MPNKIMQGYIAKDGKMVKTGDSSSGSITDHNSLTVESRALPDQHPIEAITGLQQELFRLDSKPSVPPGGTDGQLLASDGKGGARWETIINTEEMMF